MIGYRQHGGRLVVRTASGMVDCAYLLLAGNAWLGDTVPALQRKLMTIAQLHRRHRAPRRAARARAHRQQCRGLRHQLDPGLLSALARSAAAVRRAGELFRRQICAPWRPRPPGTCSGCFRSCAARASTTPGAACSTSPSTARRISAVWNPKVYFLQGFSGHGLALAGIAGELVAEALAGSAERFDVFARIPHRDFPGGVLAAPSGAGTGDAVVSAARSAVSVTRIAALQRSSDEDGRTEQGGLMNPRRHRRASSLLLVAVVYTALAGCGVADTAVSGAAGAASEAQEARAAKQTEQQVRDQVQSAQQQAAEQRDQAEKNSQ